MIGCSSYYRSFNQVLHVVSYVLSFRLGLYNRTTYPVIVYIPALMILLELVLSLDIMDIRVSALATG